MGNYWQAGVRAADMVFSGEPTADSDNAAGYLRVWYEANRESWCDRHAPFGVNRKHGSEVADNFMAALMAEVGRINAERARQGQRR